MLTHRLLALRHVIPGGLLQSYRAVPLREREQRQPDAGGDRQNTGVSVFTCVNASGIRQFGGKWPIRGYRAVTLGCCGVNVLKAKDRGGNGRPGAAEAA